MEFQAGDMIRFGWETFKKRPWIFIGAFAVVLAANWLIGFAASIFGGSWPSSFAGNALAFALQTFLSMGMTAFFLKAHEYPESVELKEMWHPAPFWKYAGATILYGLAILVGLILLVIPGFIALIALQFGNYAVIDRRLGPIAALKESMRITRGNLRELLVLFAFIVVLNIAGALALLVGLFATVPISMLALVHAYRTLEHKAGEVTPITAV